MMDALNITVNANSGVPSLPQRNSTDFREYLKLTLEKLNSVSNYIGLLIPLFISLYHTLTRKQQRLLELLRKHISTSVDLEPLIRATSFVEVFHPLYVVELLGRAKRARLQIKASRGRDNVAERNDLEERPGVTCRVLHDPGPDRVVDIIFIHGLNGALEKTWTQGIWRLGSFRILNVREATAFDIETSGSSESIQRSFCWPRDWVPQDCPKARVIAIDYTTDPYLWRPFFMTQTNRSGMEERSWEMMSRLLELGVGLHPIVWVGHSKGGLYAKQMLVNACGTVEEKYEGLRKNTKGIMFYSVPHKGSTLANINIPFFRQSIEVLEVQKNCQNVLTLHQKFLNLLEQNQLSVTIRSCIETRLTLMGRLFYLRIVTEESADAEVGESYAVPLDHRNVCKPKNRNCFLYKELLKLVNDVCELDISL